MGEALGVGEPWPPPCCGLRPWGAILRLTIFAAGSACRLSRGLSAAFFGDCETGVALASPWREGIGTGGSGRSGIGCASTTTTGATFSSAAAFTTNGRFLRCFVMTSRMTSATCVSTMLIGLEMLSLSSRRASTKVSAGNCNSSASSNILILDN